jgi:hypothetical protein
MSLSLTPKIEPFETDFTAARRVGRASGVVSQLIGTTSDTTRIGNRKGYAPR